MQQQGLMPGVGLGWRPETAWLCEARAALPFVEVIAENMPRDGSRPPALERLHERGTSIIVHGVSLSLGSGDPPEARRLARLRRVCDGLGASAVSEHLAFVRGAGHETEHLLPVPHTRAALDVVVDNVQRAQDALGRPLAVENIARLFKWPEDEIPDDDFLCELVRRTGCLLLLDVANLHADARNFGLDASRFLRSLSRDSIAYVHVAGGIERNGFWCDTHAHAIPSPVLDLLAEVVRRFGALPIVLERDDHFGTRGAIERELDQIEAFTSAEGSDVACG